MSLMIGGMLLTAAPWAPAQKPMPAPPPPPKAAPMPAPAPAPAQQPNNNVVFVEPVRVFDPFFAYPYPYAYPPDYMAQNFGYVKIKTDHKDGSVFIDGGFADKLAKSKKYALRPGNHKIELRDSDGRTLYQQEVAVTVGRTTELKAG